MPHELASGRRPLTSMPALAALTAGMIQPTGVFERPRVLYLLGRRAERVTSALAAAGFDVPPRFLMYQRGRFGWADLAEQLKSGRRPQVILADSVETVVPARWLSRVLSIPMVARVRGDAWAEVRQRGQRGAAMRVPGARALVRAYAAALRAARLVVPTARYLGARVIDEARVDPERVRPILGSIDPARYGRRDRDSARAHLGWSGGPVVVSATNFRFPQKVEGLLSIGPAMRETMHRHRDLRWVVIGSGPGCDAFRARVGAELHDAAARFELLGHVEDVPTVMTAANAYVHFSGLDGLPVAVLEAQASGRIVVANPVGGIPEVVDHDRTGLLLEDAAQLPASIDRILGSPALESRIGGAAQAFVTSNHSHAVIGAAWAAALREAAA